VIGGSFDPPHLAHLAVASEACARLGLERVLFVPAAAPPHKDAGAATSVETRVEMTELAVEGDLRFVESSLEVERELVYTRDMLDAVAARFPGRDLYFIMGSDSLVQLDTWKDPHGILARAILAVAPRHADTEELIGRAREHWDTDRIVLVQAPHIALSSTMIRERVAEGLPIRYLVPLAVEEYVRERGLYRRP
jgi:nicotinate-nucleotide adenylyltransferase